MSKVTLKGIVKLITHVLVQGDSEPRDLVAERAGWRDVLDAVLKYAGIMALAALGVVVIKMTLHFKGNVNYMSAVLERMSLSSIAALTVATMAMGFVPVLFLVATVLVALPRTSSRLRLVLIIAFPTLVAPFASVIQRSWVLTWAIAYLIIRIVHVMAERKGGKPPSLEKWGRVNQGHDDIKVREFAKRALRSEGLGEEERATLAGEINERQQELALSPGMLRLLFWFYAVGGMVISLGLASPTFSAMYEIELTSGTRVAYMIEGKSDVLLIDTRTGVPTVVMPEGIITKRLCNPKVESGGGSWLERPLVAGPDDGTPRCPN